MKIEFNDLSELDGFLVWVRDTAPVLLGAPNAPHGGVSGSVGDVAFDTPPQPLTGDHVSLDDKAPESGDARVTELPEQPDDKEAPAQPAAEPAKRKRRTKAEIDADEKAETARIAASKAANEAAEACRAENFEEAGVAMQQAAQPAAEAAKQPEGINPFAQAAEASTPPADVQGENAGESEVVTPFQHLTRAREFIAKHGMPKYNETFAKAGLDANVMAYSAYQRAVHVAALDEMDKA